MTNSLTILKNGAVPSTAFSDVDLPKTRLDEGIAGTPWARMSYMGGAWAIKHQGQTLPLKRIIDGRQEDNPNLDVVILKAAKNPTKAWYAKSFDPKAPPEGPDCFSNDGLRPDPTGRNVQNNGGPCLTCPHNAWGSAPARDDGSPSRGKACADHKKLVVVPVGDIEAKQYGGPVLLQVPPSSLKRLGPYQNELEVNGFHYAQVHTRITFERGPEISYPLFKFDALAALDDVQAAQVIKALKHPLVEQILTTAVQAGDDLWNEAAGDRAQPAPAAGTVHKLKPVETKAEPRPNQEPAPAKPAESPAVQAEPDKTGPVRKEPPLSQQDREIADLKAKLAALEGRAEAPAEKPKRGRPRQNGTRTPQVAPTNMDSEKLAGPALPEPVGPSAAANDGLPAPGNDPALDQINQTLNRAKDLI